MPSNAKHIHDVEIRDCRRISYARFAPGPGVTQILGPNGQGKSSILLAIKAGLFGPSQAGAKPIKSGKDQAQVTMKIGGAEVEVIVRRTIVTGEDGKPGDKIDFMFPNGERMKGAPTGLLKALTNGMAFDPDTFARKTEKDRIAAVLALVPGLDYDKVERARDQMLEERTEVGREVRRLEAAEQDQSAKLPGMPTDVRDVAEITAELQAISTENLAITRLEQTQQALVMRRDGVAEAFRQQTQRLETLRQSYAEAEQRAFELRASREELTQSLFDLDEPAERRPTEPLMAELQRARTLDAHRFAKQRLDETRAQLEAAKKRQADVLQNLTEADEGTRAAIAAAELPVKGLSVIDKVLTLNGEPFVQASMREQILTAIALTAATNPNGDKQLKVMIIPEGPAFDAAGLAELDEIGAKWGYQFLIERVAEADADLPAHSIIVFDGEIADQSGATPKRRAKRSAVA